MKDRRFIWQAGLAAALVAAVANLVVYLIGRAADVEFTLTPGGSVTQIGVVHVLLMSIVSVLLGTMLAVVLARGGVHRLRWAQAAGAAIAVLSAIAPLSGGWPAGVLLASMHLITGASYVLALQAVRRRSATTAAEPATTTTRR